MKRIVLALMVSVMAVLAMVGCTAAKAEDTIVVVTREANSGTRGAFLELLGAADSDFKNGSVVATSTAAVLESVAGNKYAIGYASTGSVDSSVKAVKVEGIESTSENILAGTYKLARPFVVIYRDLTAGSVEEDFLKYLKSKQVQDIAMAKGLVKITDEGFGETYVKPATDFAAATLTLTGSTSQKEFMEKVGEEYKKLNPSVTVIVGGTGSGDAYKAVHTNNTAQFGLLSRETKSSEKTGVNEINVAKDGISVVINKNNASVENLTFEQLRLIFLAPIEAWSHFE